MDAVSFRRRAVAALACLAVSFPLLVPAQGTGVVPSPSSGDEDDESELIVLSPFCVTAGNFGATPGGAQDINYFRSGAGRGEIPHPTTFTAEGLFSEYDLPLEMRDPGDALLCVQTAAVAARFEVLPEVRWLAQLGFSSGLRPETWTRAPLNLVAVVDKSGSMDGPPLALVRASLRSALDHLTDGDQLSIVLYGDSSHVFLQPTVVGPETRSVIAERIGAIHSAGSTWMEAGLKLGYEVALNSARTFEGTTRVMLFTDERPNVGNTTAAGFMAMAETGSRDGIGLTTIGVGVQFGAELATKISSVRGGNLFFFPDGAEMTRTFEEDFDTLVTELAHDFSVRIEPVAGVRIAGAFGVPGEMLRWDGRALVLDVATLFLSKRKGAIYFALAPEETGTGLSEPAPAAGDRLAAVSLSFLDHVSNARVSATEECRVVDTSRAQAGLRRGALLVDEFLCLKKAAMLHLVQNDQEGAFRLVHGLLGRLAAANDPELGGELKLAGDMHGTLALLSGHAGDVSSAKVGGGKSPLVGVWRQRSRRWFAPRDRYAIFWPNGVVELIAVDRHTKAPRQAESFTVGAEIPAEPRGVLELSAGDAERLGDVRFALDGASLRLRVEHFDGKPATWTLERCAYADLPLPAPESDEDEIVELSDCSIDFSGLPDQPTDAPGAANENPTAPTMAMH